MTTKAGNYSSKTTYELCATTFMGNTKKFKNLLLAYTDIKENIDTMLLLDKVLTIVTDVLKREFYGFSLLIETIEKEQSLVALIKLQICDRFYFKNYAYEF